MCFLTSNFLLDFSTKNVLYAVKKKKKKNQSRQTKNNELWQVDAIIFSFFFSQYKNNFFVFKCYLFYIRIFICVSITWYHSLFTFSSPHSNMYRGKIKILYINKEPSKRQKWFRIVCIADLTSNKIRIKIIRWILRNSFFFFLF